MSELFSVLISYVLCYNSICLNHCTGMQIVFVVAVISMCVGTAGYTQYFQLVVSRAKISENRVGRSI